MDIFDLSAKITLDSSEFERGVNDAGGHMDGLSAKAVALGNALYDIGKKAAEGFGSLVSAAVGGYAQFEQLTGGIDTLFGDSSAKMQEFADQAYKTAGMSANEYMSTVTGFSAALIRSVGGDTERAADLANTAITDMSDNANKMGTSLESLQNAYTGFSRGNFTMLDNLALGFSGTKEGMRELLDTAEQLSGIEYDISSYADIVDAIHVVQSEMGITGTTAAEASNTISGSVDTMKAAWDNWLTGLGDADADMSGLTDSLIDAAQTAWSNIEPVLSQIKTNLAAVFTDLTGIDLSGITSKFSELSGSLSQTFAPVIDSLQSGGFSAAFDTLLSSLQNITGIDISPFTGGIQTLMSALDGLKADGVSGALENIVGSFENITGLDLSNIKEQFGQFGEAIDQVATAFNEGGLGAAVDELMSQLDNLTGLDISGFFDGLGEAYSSLTEKFSEGGLSSVLQGLVDGFSEAGPKILEAGQNILAAVGDLITQIGQQIYEMLPENIQGLVDSIGNLFSSLGDYLGALWEQIQPVVALIGTAMLGQIKTAWENIKIVFNTLVDSLTHVFDFIAAQLDFAVALWEGDFKKAAQAIKDSWNAVVDFFGGIIDGIKSLFEGLVSYFSEIGGRLWEGLKSGLSAAVDGVKGIASNIADGFKDFFGIHSPSRLFAEYGGYMAEGLEKGWNSEIDSIVRDMSKAVSIQGTVDYASSSLGKSSSAQINTMLTGMSERGGNYNINLVVDGRTLANVVFDPLNAVSKQKGVTIGA